MELVPQPVLLLHGGAWAIPDQAVDAHQHGVQQALNAGWRVLFAPWLRVYHDTELHHHVSPRVTAGSLTNRALLAFVRYPVRYWGWGVGQYANAFVYSLRMNRRKGLGRGLRETLPTLWDYRSERHPVGPEAIATYRRLRHGSEVASPPRLPEG